jgi:hypothetical protein
MLTDLDLFGAFVPALAVWFVACLPLFVLVDAALTRARFYRLFWHPPLARFALFTCMLIGGFWLLERQ